MPLTIKPSSGSGSITLQATTGTTTNDTLTLPAKTGNIITSADSGTVTQTMLGTNVAGNGPVFSAYATGTTSVSNNTNTKVALAATDFDTASCFNTSTSRFTPNIAGYYLFVGSVGWGAAVSYAPAKLYKNGSETKVGFSTTSAVINGASILSILYMNGSTDYVELYTVQATGSTQTVNSGGNVTFLNGSLIRSA